MCLGFPVASHQLCVVLSPSLLRLLSAPTTQFHRGRTATYLMVSTRNSAKNCVPSFVDFLNLFYKMAQVFPINRSCFLNTSAPDVDPESGKATSIRLMNFSRPHMRSFHMAWFTFFTAFFAWFAVPSMFPYLKMPPCADFTGEFCSVACAVSSSSTKSSSDMQILSASESGTSSLHRFVSPVRVLVDSGGGPSTAIGTCDPCNANKCGGVTLSQVNSFSFAASCRLC